MQISHDMGTQDDFRQAEKEKKICVPLFHW